MARLSQKERIEQLTEDMNKGIENFQEQLKEQLELLNYLQRFNQYSTRNIVLIKNQYEGAVGVQSYKKHQEQGYQVQKGEKAIRILAPKTQDVFFDEDNTMKFLSQASKEQKVKIQKGELTQQQNKIVGYLSVPVFDLTQTDCPVEDYPNLYPNRPENYSFENSKEDLKDLEQAIETIAQKDGISISDEVIHSSAKGYYEPATDKIVLQESLSETERPKVLLHELAHAKMHNSNHIQEKIENNQDISTPILEYQAEMTAYVVSSEIGLDTEEGSLSYLANWKQANPDTTLDSDNYIQALDEVRKVSSELSSEVFSEYQNRNQTQQQDHPTEQIDVTLTYTTHEGVEKSVDVTYPSDNQPAQQIIREEDIDTMEVSNLPPAISYLNGTIQANEAVRLEDNLQQGTVTSVQEKYPIEDTDIAQNMNFLTDDKGNNHYQSLENTTLKPEAIFVNKKQSYQENYIQLTDGNQRFNQRITTPPLTNQELKQWGSGKTGKEWLQNDLTFNVHKDLPHKPIKPTNFSNSDDVSKQLQPFEKLNQEQKQSQTTPSM